MYTMAEVAEITRQVYEQEYQKTVKVNITGTEPVATNHFKVSLKKLNNIGFTEDERFYLGTEIKEIFKYLKLKQ